MAEIKEEAKVKSALQVISTIASTLPACDRDKLLEATKTLEANLVINVKSKGMKMGRGGKSGQTYRLIALVEALLVSRLLRNSSYLCDVLIRSVHFCFGAPAAQSVKNSIASGAVNVPSSATLCRARVKLDLILMAWRQKQWVASSDEFIFLSADSTWLEGSDYMMTIQDSITYEDAASVIDASDEELAAFNEGMNLRTAVLPLGIVGAGQLR